MELTSENDYRLLRNIVCVKKVLTETKSPEQKETIELYNNLLQLLNSGNTIEVNKLLSTSSGNRDFSEFSQSITTKSSKNLCYEYVSMIKALNLPKDKFSKFLEIFFKNNEELNPLYANIDTKKIHLATIQKLLQKISKKSTPQEFKGFSNSYAVNTNKLAKEIYKNYFESNNKKLLNMKISYGKNQSTYITTLKTVDNFTNEISNLKLEEVAPPSGFACTNYQNLCCSYLEPYTCSKTDDNLITPDFIQTKINNFKRYFEGIKSMLNCKIAILNGKLMCYAETYKTPGEQPEKLSNDYKER